MALQPNSSSDSVKIVEVCKVTPDYSTVDGTPADLSLPLTYFDIFWVRFPPVQRLYFYKFKLTSSDSILENLKTSLSLVLRHFLPLAGNLTWPRDFDTPVLTYVQGDAVSLVVAESEADNRFDYLSSHDDFVQARDYHPLVPRLAVSHERAAAMALQVTLFPGHGFVIGTTMHHAILDGKSSTSFVKSWAHACKHLMSTVNSGDLTEFSLPEQLKPLFDRTVIHDPTGLGLGSLFSNAWRNMDGPDNKSVMIWEFKAPPPDSVRGIFEFTRARIQTLRQIVLDASSDSSTLRLSTFTLVCAYTWVCLVKAQQVDGDKTTIQTISTDCRARLDPPVPANYFGNCVSGALGFRQAKELLAEGGFVVAVKAISEAIEAIEKEVVSREVWVSKIKDMVQTDGVYSTAGSPRFQIYETDFGWGRPDKVEVVSIDRTGAIALSDSKNGGGGVEVGVVLRKQAMEAFASLFLKGFGDH